MLDEADIYAPAVSQPASKGRVMDLLRRGRSAGLGLLLATQNPGDLDYKGRENIKSWFVFKISEQHSINKIKPLLADGHAAGFLDRIPSFPVGQFLFARSPDAVAVAADRSLLKTDQLSEDEIRACAARIRTSTQRP
jgi:DNA helicase HerA-like ATPase